MVKRRRAPGALGARGPVRCALAVAAALVVLGPGAAASAAPVVRSGSAITATVVDCDGALDCWLARQLVPGAWMSPRKALLVDGAAEVGSWSAGAIASGERGGDTMPPRAIGLDLAQASATVGTAVVPIAFELEGLPPDRYHGVVRLGGGELAPTEIPLDVSVRSGPGGPLLWLLAGVVIGLLLKFWRERGQRLAKTASEIDRLTAIVREGGVADRRVLAPMLAEAREAMYREQLDAADAALASIEARRGMLAALARLLAALPGKRAEIEHVRSLIARRRDPQAEAAIAALEKVADAADGGATARSFRVVADRRAPIEAPETTHPSRPRRLWFWILQHVAGRALRVAAVAAAMALGLKVMYVDSGATYGTSPFFDGVALFVWGLGAEISSRSFFALGRILARTSTSPAGEPPEAELAAAAGGGGLPAGGSLGDEPSAAGGERTLSVPSDVVIRELREPEAQTKELDRAARWPHDALKLDEISRLGFEDGEVTIAVIDSGVASDQQRLDWSRIRMLDLQDGTGEDLHGHGTCMVGILASDRGVCLRANVISIRALDSQGTATPGEIARAIDLAVGQGVDVISISAGQSSPDAELEAAVQRACEQGILVVAAIRKENPSGSAFPARCDGVISVTPSRRNGHLRYPGPPSWISVAAPGERIPTYGPKAPVEIDGASAATAVVAGVCARLLGSCEGAARRELAKRLDEVLRSTASKQDGGRLIDVLKATQTIQET